MIFAAYIGNSEGYRLEVGGVVTADAVRFGGGMGNFARNGMTSGLPRSAEGARYWLQWAGIDTTIFHQNEGKHEELLALNGYYYKKLNEMQAL